MSSRYHPHDALLKAIGADVVRAHFAHTPQRLHNWRKRGVPYPHRGAVAQLAALHGVAVPADFFAPPPVKQGRAAA